MSGAALQILRRSSRLPDGHPKSCCGTTMIRFRPKHFSAAVATSREGPPVFGFRSGLAPPPRDAQVIAGTICRDGYRCIHPQEALVKKLLVAGIAASMVYTIAARAADDDPPPHHRVSGPGSRSGSAMISASPLPVATRSASNMTLVARFGVVLTSPWSRVSSSLTSGLVCHFSR
jgi:hypothetical protein